jgi:bifunctional DNase/RNase
VGKIELEVHSIYSNQPQTNSFAMVLGEVGGNRRLPIIIGHTEAHAIAMVHDNLKVNRPMTHDLFISFGEAFGFSVDEILINDLKEGIFIATIYCSNAGKQVEIDARPSDAVAIALRFGAPIFVTEQVLSEGGIEMEEEEKNMESRGSKSTPSAGTVSPKSKGEKLENLSVKKLEEMLQKALDREDYESAAKIRDILNKKN